MTSKTYDALILLIIVGVTILFMFMQKLSPSYPTHESWVGWACSSYGHQQDLTSSYWVNVTTEMNVKISNSEPSGIWVLSVIWEDGECHLQFPNPTNKTYQYISFSDTDENEPYLDAFDDAGVKVWLSVESGYADMETLIDLVLSRYKHHSCVVGFSIDLEWYQNPLYEDGKAVSNDEAYRWLNRVKSYKQDYKLLLIHWLSSKMPPQHFPDIVFMSDDQGFSSMSEFVDDFKQWGNTFADAEVGYCIGFETDREWWMELADPLIELTNTLIGSIPNCKMVYWVHFTIEEVYPP